MYVQSEKPKKCPRCRMALRRAEHERGRPFKCVGCGLVPNDCRCRIAANVLEDFGRAPALPVETGPEERLEDEDERESLEQGARL